MNGKTALNYLKEMSEDELQSVELIWFDRDTLRENLKCNEDEDEKSFEKKIDFIDKMSNEEVGQILQDALYCQSGDIQNYFNDFLDEHDDIMTDKFNEFYGE